MLKAKVEEQSLIVTIIDSGKGISKEKVKHIFKEFTQENDSFTKEVDGLGVGLAICAKVIKSMNAKISVSSKENVGTKFKITFPL